MNEDAVCKHCHKVIRTVPKHYCPRSPNQVHEPVEAAPAPAVTLADSPTGGQISNDPKTCKHPVEWRDEGVCKLCGSVTQFTIDITPAGCQTPEGIARVNKAMREFDDATAEVANAATRFFDDHRLTLVEVAGGVSICEDDRIALKDDLRQLQAIIGTRRPKQEALLRAIAGAPPEPSFELKPVSRENNYCNGTGPHTPGEVRVMPTGGGGNDILCRSCWQRALEDRRERNRAIRHPVAHAFDLLPWESAKVYDPGE